MDETKEPRTQVPLTAEQKQKLLALAAIKGESYSVPQAVVYAVDRLIDDPGDLNVQEEKMVASALKAWRNADANWRNMLTWLLADKIEREIEPKK